jgi:hypothetical protein
MVLLVYQWYFSFSFFLLNSLDLCGIPDLCSEFEVRNKCDAMVENVWLPLMVLSLLSLFLSPLSPRRE